MIHYLGVGARYGKVSELAYHNSLMVQIWSMLASRDVRLSVHVLRAISDVPSTTAWITYVRCHDDIGWAIDDADAAAVYLSGWSHRRFLSDFYSGDYWQSPARGLVFQDNEVTGDRRISGMTASLAGLDAALEAGDEAAVQTAIDRILLAHAIVLGWGGVPVIWMGDELALRNDPDWAADPAHATDNRWVHRPRMPWDVAERRPGIDRAAGLRRARPPGCGPCRRWSTSTPRSVPSRWRRPIPVCWPSCAAIRSARCSGSTT